MMDEYTFWRKMGATVFYYLETQHAVQHITDALGMGYWVKFDVVIQKGEAIRIVGVW